MTVERLRDLAEKDESDASSNSNQAPAVDSDEVDPPQHQPKSKKCNFHRQCPLMFRECVSVVL